MNGAEWFPSTAIVFGCCGVKNVCIMTLFNGQNYSRCQKFKTKVDFCVRSYLFRNIASESFAIVSSFLVSESVAQETF